MNTSTMPDRKHIDAAGYFLECLQSNGKISQHDKMRVISSAIVTLADAATICGISAQELWFNYVRLGTLRMYNGDAPATDFIKVTILLQNVMEFFCEQERIKRNHAQSYQNIVKDFIKFGIKNEDDRKQVVQWLSKYFSLPQSEAINFESCTIALSRFFILHPINTIDVSYSCTNSLDNSNNITIENNIDINGLIQVLIDLTETISRAQTTNGNSSSPQESAFWQENPSTNGKQTEAAPPQPLETEKHIKAWAAVLPELRGAERAAAKIAIEKWRNKSHMEAYRAAIPDGCADNPKEYVSKKKSTAENVAKRHNLTMPYWQSKN